MTYHLQHLFLILTLIYLSGCSSREETTHAQWPESIDQAVEITLSELPETDKASLRSMNKADLIRLHKTLGAEIRNNLGLLQGNDALRDAACSIDVSAYYPIKIAQDADADKDCSPDKASMAIIGKAWEALQ